MKKYKSKIPVMALGVILSGLLSVQPVVASPVTAGSDQAKQNTEAAAATANKAAQEKREKYSSEVITAIKAVDEAIDLLDAGKSNDALKKLEMASGKLDVALAAEPSLELVPVGTDVFTFDLIASPKTVKAELTSIKDLLDTGDVQTARGLLNGMHSEIVTETTYLPVETYPGAIKRAVKEISANQAIQARDTLLIARDSLVEEVVVTPLPVILAHGAIEAAEKAQKNDKVKALLDLDYASEQVETAKLLGYFVDDKVEYEAISENIKDLRHAINGKTKTEKLFEDAKSSVQKLLHKFEGKKTKTSVNKDKS